MPPISPPPFIASHRLKRLMLSDDQRLDAQGELRKGRDERLDFGSEGDVRRDTKLWKMVDRFEFFQSLQYKRIAITVDGGFGKSIALQQIQYVRQKMYPNHLVLKFDLADLPEVAEQYFAKPYRSEDRPFLANWMYTLMLEPVSAGKETFDPVNIPNDALSGWLTSLAKRGQLTLMVDGLDQAEREMGKHRIEALKTVLRWNPEIHCVAAGRPSSIEEYWQLFSNNNFDASDWQFWMIPEFDDREIATYVGTSRYERLKTLDATALFVPRTLEVVRTLADEEFQDCHSAADLYYKSIQKTLRLDTDKHKSAGWHDFNPSQILDCYSAIAYLLVMGEGGPILQVESDVDFERLIAALDACLSTSIRHGMSVNEVLNQLASINANAIDFAFWPGIDIRRLRWRNSTLRDFLAAVWLLKGASSEQLGSFGKEQLKGKMSATWKFVCQFPIEDLLADYGASRASANYLNLTGQLFEKRNHSRPTELMYLAWPRLLARAGFLDQGTADEAKILASTQQAQKWVQGPAVRPPSAASRIVFDFLREYLNLKGCGDAEIDKFESSFRAIPAGQFLYGYFAREEIIATPFRLSAFQVWNALYERFDKHHADRFWNYKLLSPYVRGAAIKKNWYDSWVFAIWSHSYLPNEFEWEAACRGRVGDLDRSHHTTYCYGNDKSQLGEYAWCNDNSALLEFPPEPSPLTGAFWSRIRERLFSYVRARRKSTVVELTEPHVHTVGQKKANGYGLYDVHGNVWEWTSSWYDKHRVSRCLRGGSYYYHGDSAWSRFYERDSSDPQVQTDAVSGFRVARDEF